MTQPHHDDPFADARNQMVQSLAVAATVGEAAARWAAVGIQNRAARTERQSAIDEADEAARRLANQKQDNQDRDLIDQGLTDWLSHATMEDTVRLWRTATVHAAGGNSRAGKAAGLAQDRLRDMNAPLMDAYDRHRAAGMGQAEAMKAAAYEMWEAQARSYRPPHPSARPHGTREPSPLGQHGPAELDGGPGMLDEMDAAVRVEAGRLARHISPEALDRLQREWRAAGMAPAADAAGLLAQLAREAASTGTMPRTAADALLNSLQAQADVERRSSELDDAKPDNRATPNLNEHHQAQDRGKVHTGIADADADTAADTSAAGLRQRVLMSQSFPPLTVIGKVPPHVAAKYPANVVTALRKARNR